MGCTVGILQSVRCINHDRTAATHFSDEEDKFYCRRCYKEQKNKGGIYEIKIYFNDTPEFKRRQMQLNQKATKSRKNAEDEIRRIEQLKISNSRAKHDFIEDLNKFVNFVNILKDTLCREIESTSNDCITALENGLSKFKDIRDEAKAVESNIGSIPVLPRGNEAKGIQLALTESRHLDEIQAKIKYAMPNTDLKLTLEYETQLTLTAILDAMQSDKDRIQLGHASVTKLSQTDIAGCSARPEIGINKVSKSRSAATSLVDQPGSSNYQQSSNVKRISVQEYEEPGPAYSISTKTGQRMDSQSSSHRTSTAVQETNSYSTSKKPGQKPAVVGPSGNALDPIPENRPLMTRLRIIPSPQLYKRLYYNITGSVELEDGCVVLCDEWSKALTLLTPNLTRSHRLTLKGTPHNVTVEEGCDNVVAVTIPDKNMIQFIEIKDQQLVDSNRSVPTKPDCRGIEFIDNNLIYTAGNEVFIHENNTIQFNFKNPVSLMADRENKTLYVSCQGFEGCPGEVVVVNLSNGRIDTLSHTDMEHPIYCTKSHDGYLYVCSGGGIHRLSPNGDYCGTAHISEKQHALSQIQHAQFMSRNNYFLVTEEHGDRLTCWEIK